MRQENTKENGMMKKLWTASVAYFILALVAGVFYREFTKFNGYEGKTVLSAVHPHLFVLGMFLFLMIILFALQNQKLCEEKMFRRFFVFYQISLPFMIGMMLIRGIVQVLLLPLTKAGNAMISGFAGISHLFMTISFAMLFLAFHRTFQTKE
jgi:uncharacterized integral membrane protein